MKKFFIALFKLLLLAAAVFGCIVFYLYTVGYYSPAPSVGLLRAPSGQAHLDGEALRSGLAAEGVQLLTAAEGESAEAAARRLLDEGAKVLVLPLDSAAVDREVLALATAAGAEVLCVGEEPDSAALKASGSLWYLGFLPAHGGELLGQAMAMDWREGAVADKNGDLILQYYIHQGAPTADGQDLTSCALLECEHYGVYSALVEYKDEAGAALAFTAEALAGQTAPEVILCPDAGATRQALETAAALGWLEGEQPVRVYGAASSPAEAAALVEAGALAAAYQDPAAAGAAAAQLALNILEHRFPGTETELTADEAGRFLLPCGLAR